MLVDCLVVVWFVVTVTCGLILLSYCWCSILALLVLIVLLSFILCYFK